MVGCVFLSLGFIQIAVGLEYAQPPKVFRTAPYVVPCMEWLKSSVVNQNSLLIPSPCGCVQSGYNTDDSNQNSQTETEEVSDCVCSDVDSQQNSEGGNEGPSFNAAMLAPIATALTSIMSRLSSSGDQAVTIDFDGQTCDIPTINEAPPDSSQSHQLQCMDPPSNWSHSEIPPQNVEMIDTSSPIKSDNAVKQAQQFPVTDNTEHSKHGVQFRARQFCRQGNRKGVSDIEEDSLYAFGPNHPEQKCTCPSNFNQGLAYEALPLNSYSTNTVIQQQNVDKLENNNSPQQHFQKENNMVQLSNSGNSQFDIISKISSMFSSPKSNANIQPINQERNLMPCHCCC